MISYDPRLTSGGGNLANAVGLWNNFFGPQSKQNAATLAATKQSTEQSGELFPSQLAATQADTGVKVRQGELERNAEAAQQASTGFTEKDFNDAFQQPLSRDNPRFWSQLDEGEQRHVQKLFALNSTAAGNPVTNGSVVPDAYDSWVGRKYNIMPPIRLPMSGFPGVEPPVDQTKTSVGTEGYHQTPQFSLGTDGTPHLSMVRVPNTPTDADRALIRKDPVNAPSMFPDAMRPVAESIAKNVNENLARYQTEVPKDAAIQTYLTGSGEQAGLLPTWQDIDRMRQKHLDAQGNWKGDLTPQEATTLIFRVAHMDNPGSIVRDSTWEQVLKGSPVLDQWSAYLKGAATGQRVPAVVVKGLYDLADSLKSSAEQRAQTALSSWEPELKQHGLELDDVIHNRPFLNSYRNAVAGGSGQGNGSTPSASTGATKENPVDVKSQEDFSNLDGGTWYRDSQGTVALKSGGPAKRAAKSSAKQAPSGELPLVNPFSLQFGKAQRPPQVAAPLPEVGQNSVSSIGGAATPAMVTNFQRQQMRDELNRIEALPPWGRTADVLQRRAQILQQLGGKP